MKLITDSECIGKELEFYARFPEEIDTLLEFESDVVQSHFGITEDEYTALYESISEIAGHAENQAKRVIDVYISLLSDLKHVRISPIKRQGKLKCKLNLLPRKGKPPSRWNLMVGLSIETNKNRLLIISWIWKRGFDKNKIYEVLRKDVANSTIQDNPPDAGWSDESLCFFSENLLNIAGRAESIKSLAQRLADPILRIPQNRWFELTEIIK